MVQIELTNEEIQFLFNVLDQLNLKGMKPKQLVLTIMIKLFESTQPNSENDA